MITAKKAFSNSTKYSKFMLQKIDEEIILASKEGKFKIYYHDFVEKYEERINNITSKLINSGYTVIIHYNNLGITYEISWINN